MYRFPVIHLARFRPLIAWLFGFCLVAAAHAQYGIGRGPVKKLYNQYCANCHGENLREGTGGSLVDGAWTKIPDGVSPTDYILDGNEDMGMPSFEESLSRKQARALVIYMEERRQMARREQKTMPTPDLGVIKTEEATFALEEVVSGLRLPWALEFFPGGGMIITERNGDVHLFQDGSLSEPVTDVPEVWARGQGGMLDVALHPDYASNEWIYLSYSQPAPGGAQGAMTAIMRGRIRDGAWVDSEMIYEPDPRFFTGRGQHFGTRIVFRDGYLFFPIGDRGAKEQAQNLSRPSGKHHRIFDDGRIPEDNPFQDKPNALPTLWTYGNRNPQGLAIHPQTGNIWSAEHGPRGGDEVNLIERGTNYGWPVITYGMNYNGTPMTDRTSAPGMAQPELYWTPSIAVCGIDFYSGKRFPGWQDNLFAGGLASEEVHRLVIEDREIVHQEIILKGAGRVRDVKNGGDGYLYLVLNGPGRIVRLVPAHGDR